METKLERTLTSKEVNLTHKKAKTTQILYSIMFLTMAIIVASVFPNDWYEAGWKFGGIFKWSLFGIFMSFSVIYLGLYIKVSSKANIALRMETILMYKWYNKPYMLWGSYKNMFAFVILMPFGVLNWVWVIDLFDNGVSTYIWKYMLVCLTLTTIFFFYYQWDKMNWRMLRRKLELHHGNTSINKMVKVREMEENFSKPNTFANAIFNVRKTWKRDFIFWLAFCSSLLVFTPVFIKMLKYLFRKYDPTRKIRTTL